MKLAPDYWKSVNYFKHDLDSPGNIGIGTHIAKDQVQELKAKIFKGAGSIELGFAGRSKGNMGQGNTTPGMYGKDEREAMRDLAKVNKVRLSTHASAGVGSWSGINENRFDENARGQNIIEGKRALEFAAEVAGGGPVVIHTGEFPRAISRSGEETKKDELFTTLAEDHSHLDEDQSQRIHYLMDKKTGQLITGVREDMKNFMPVEVDTKEKDAWGRPIKHLEWREDMPEGGEFKIKPRDWTYYVKKSKDNQKSFPNVDAEAENYRANHSHDPAVLFWFDNMEAKRLQTQGQADEYEESYRAAKENRENILESLNYWKKEWKNIPKKDQWKHYEAVPIDRLQKTHHIRNKVEYFQRELEDTEKRLSYTKETAASARSQEAQIIDEQKRLTSLSNYGLHKTADSIAQMAIYAAEQEKKNNLKRDLFIAAENIFPEMGYGSHPEELKRIITDSREQMVNLLTNPKSGNFYQPGLSTAKAEEMAEKHIKATFDIGHAHTWKKYFKKTDGESQESADKRFDKWMMDQVEELNKAKALGHVHITDNFGYYDEHLSPGQGNAPIKDFMGKLRKIGYKGQITVETAQQDFKAMTEMWRMANSPIYKIDSTSRGWTDVESNHFGYTHSPEFIFGEYAPDPKMWSPWNDMPME